MKVSLVYTLSCLLLLTPVLTQAQDDSERNDLEAKLREVVPPETDAASIQIIDKHLQVVGGIGLLKTITNTVSKGTKREGKKEVEITIYRAAPDELRIETIKHEMGRPETHIEATNGDISWTYRPEEKNALPVEMPQKDADRLKVEADFYGPLVDWREKGYVFRYEGTVKSRGRKHYLLRMFFPNGRYTFFYFDAKTLMVTRVGHDEVMNKTIVQQDTYYTKFDRVDGVWMPTKMEFALEDQVYGSLIFDSIKANQPLEAGLFDIPRVKEVWIRQQR